MKEIVFRPLRRVKKTGKIVVASYMQWRKIATADYNKFKLIVDDEYKRLPSDEFVYDHKGELLFWFTYKPVDIPVLDASPNFNYEAARKKYGHQFIIAHNDGYIAYLVSGLDCDGVPTFSHYQQDRVARDYEDMSKFDPLTVKTVTQWLGWFLYNLKNSYLQIGK